MRPNHERSQNKHYNDHRRKRKRSYKQKHRRQKEKEQYNEPSDNDDVMKDILAQLQLQRSKQNREQNDASSVNQAASKTEDNVTRTSATNSNSKQCIPKKLGNYVYDSKCNKYFLSNNNNDNGNTSTGANSSARKCIHKCSSTSKEDLEKTRITMSKYPYCAYKSNRSSLEIFWQNRRTCVFPRLRNVIAQDWIASTVGGCNKNYKHILPITSSNQKNKWYSILCPILPQNSNDYSQNSSTPLDCICKSYLHPSAPTFDIISSTTIKYPALPHVATIVHGGGIYYRPPKTVTHNTSCWEIPLRSYHNEGKFISLASGFGPTISNDCYRAIQFLPFKRNLASINNEVDLYVGAIAKERSRQSFTVGFCPQNGNIHSTQYDFLNYAVALPVPINNFCFSPYLWNAPNGGNVEFAPNTMGKQMLPAMSLDLETMTLFTISNWEKSPSDAFCVEYFRGDKSGNTVLYGHRNGTISILDKRSGKFNIIQNHNSRRDSFGSTTSIATIPVGNIFDQPTNEVRYDSNQLLAKGSFGALHLHDLRCLCDFNGTSRHRRNSNRSMMQEFQRPESLLQNSPQRCNGIVIDPISTSLIVSPFMSDQKDHVLGVWSLSSGKIINQIPLNDEVSEARSRDCSSSNHDQPINSFCELSKSVTHGWHLTNSCEGKGVIDDYTNDNMEYNESTRIQRRKGSWGIWIKCGNALYNSSNVPPPEVGGINHVTFRGSLTL